MYRCSFLADGAPTKDTVGILLQKLRCVRICCLTLENLHGTRSVLGVKAVACSNCIMDGVRLLHSRSRHSLSCFCFEGACEQCAVFDYDAPSNEELQSPRSRVYFHQGPQSKSCIQTD